MSNIVKKRETKQNNDCNKSDNGSDSEYNDNNMVPYTSLPNILNKVNIYSPDQSEIKFYDFGGNNLELYAYLNKNLKKKLFYYYHDQKQFNKIIEKIVDDKNLKNIKVDN